MQYQVRIEGGKEVKAKLLKLGPSLLKFKPEFKEIGEEVSKYYAGQVFASRGKVIGEPWKALTPAYKRRKAKRYPGAGLLVATGKMQESFQAAATDTGVTITNTAPYFKYHQSTEPRTKMPYRPMMGVNKEVKSIIKTILETGVRKKINAVNL